MHPGKNILETSWFPLVLFLAFALFYSWNLGKRDFWNPDEAEFVQTVREMEERGDFVVPYLNGQPYSEKPVLFYYAIWLSQKLFGAPFEFSARLPSALAGALGVLIAFLFGRRMFSPQAGLLAALVLGTGAQYLWKATFLQTDMLFSGFCILATYLLWKVFDGPRHPFWRLALWMYVALALAVLTKGPLAVVLVGLTGGLFLLGEEGKRGRISKLHLLPGAAVVLFLAGWWYAAVGAAAGESFLWGSIVRENLLRFLGSDSHAQPVYYYFISIWPDLLPWSVLLPFALWTSWKHRGNRNVRFLWCWFGASFLFLTMCTSKQGKYLLPAFPALALMTSYAVAAWEAKEGNRRIFKRGLDVFSAIFVVGGTAAISISFGADLLGWVERLVPFPKFEVEEAYAFAAVFHPLLGGGLLALIQRFRSASFRLGVLGLSLAFGFLIFTGYYGDLNRLKSPRELLERASREMEADSRFGVFGSFRGAYAYYTGRKVREIRDASELEDFFEEPGAAYCLVRHWELHGKVKPKLEGRFWVLDQDEVWNRQLFLIGNKPPKNH